jgi:4-hydroxybenzoate polyprenyltransferase
MLPPRWRDYALLARLDRPIGSWLLFWPCAWSVALAGALPGDWRLLLWLGLGAVAMRGAGCVYNDIVDRDLDAKVERTRARPIASGRVSPGAAWAWLVVLCLIGLVVLLQLPLLAQLIALGSLALVAAYPFMKRITWWPQAWLGLVFTWGALVGWPAATGGFDWPALALYAGAFWWVMGYDTIYALQDVEDDAIAGVKSSARRLGARARPGIAIFYTLSLAGLGSALWLRLPDPLVLAGLIPAALHFAWQTVTLDPADGANALHRFRSNRFAGLLIFMAALAVGSA